MFKLPNHPSPQADVNELADFAELLAWTSESATVSQREIIAYLGRLDENDNNFGCNDNDDKNSEIIDEVMNEIDRRVSACNGGYPFRLELEGTVLKYTQNSDPKSILYLYLLLSTRLNMKEERSHAGIDGTALLEEIASKVLKNYLGRARARSMVFGTAAPGNFKSKIDALCRELGEGTGFRQLSTGPVKAKDDKLDAIAWVPFSDSLPGKLIIFGQCKTGTKWDTSISQLQPDAFIKKWIEGPIMVMPVRAFCISEAVDRSQWLNKCADAGIIFDRCRLVDFCEIDNSLSEQILNWNSAVKEKILTHFYSKMYNNHPIMM